MGKRFVVIRGEDMSLDGRLIVTRQMDGDFVITIVQGKDYGIDSEPGLEVSVEFCNSFNGGGRSPKTYAALKNLMIAMAEDNLANDIGTGNSTDKTVSSWVKAE